MAVNHDRKRKQTIFFVLIFSKTRVLFYWMSYPGNGNKLAIVPLNEHQSAGKNVWINNWKINYTSNNEVQSCSHALPLLLVCFLTNTYENTPSYKPIITAIFLRIILYFPTKTVFLSCLEAGNAKCSYKNSHSRALVRRRQEALFGFGSLEFGRLIYQVSGYTFEQRDPEKYRNPVFCPSLPALVLNAEEGTSRASVGPILARAVLIKSFPRTLLQEQRNCLWVELLLPARWKTRESHRREHSARICVSFHSLNALWYTNAGR